VFEHCISLIDGDSWTEALYNRVVDDPVVGKDDGVWDDFEAYKVANGDIVGAARVRWRADARA
jgi:hypothetical protein